MTITTPATGRKGPRSASKRGSFAPPNIDGDLQTRAKLIRDEISAKFLSDSMSAISINGDKKGGMPSQQSIAEEAKEEITAAILNCVDSVFVTVATLGKASASAWTESTDRIFDLAATLSCGSGDGHIANTILSRATQFSLNKDETIRVQACKLLGLCVKNLLETQTQSAARQMVEGRQSASTLAFLMGSNNDEHDSSWRKECANVASSALLARLDDKSQAVRKSAIHACAFFFDDTRCRDVDAEGEVRNCGYPNVADALFVRLAYDTSFANRVAAVQSAPITKESLPHILARVRDTKDKVRMEALDVLRTKVDVHYLTEDQRVDLLRSGLTDRCRQTYEGTTKMLCCGWMKSLKFDPVDLTSLLDPAINEDVCENAIRAILGAATNEETATDTEGMNTSTKITLKELSDPEIRAYKEGVHRPLKIEDENPVDPALVLYVRVMCNTIMETKSLIASRKTESISKIVPDIPRLCEVLQKHLGQLIGSIRSREPSGNEEDVDEEVATFEDNHCFICLQLLQLARVADLQEEGSRRHFVSVMQDMLKSLETPDDLIEGCVRALSAAHDTESHFLQTISELLSEFAETGTEEKNVSAENTHKLRVVAILSVVLENTSGKMTSSPILNNFSSFILPAVVADDAMVREGGVCCLGKYALLSNEESVLAELAPLLLQVASNGDERTEIRAQAALAMCDLAFIYDNMMSPRRSCPDSDAGEKLSLSMVLSEMLCNSNSALATIAAEITAKLHFAGKIHASTMLAHLLLMFFDQYSSGPTISAEYIDEVKEVGCPLRLQQILSVFFPAYSLRYKEGREALLGSIQPLLSLVEEKLNYKAKGTKRLASWPIVKCIEYICSLVDIGEEKGGYTSATTDGNKEDNEEGSATGAAAEDNDDCDNREQTASSTLVASIAVSEYLTVTSSTLTTSHMRTLCKILGGARIDAGFEDPAQLKELMKNLDELLMLITDEACIRNLEKISETIEMTEATEENDNRDSEESTESLADAIENMKIIDESALSSPQTEVESTLPATPIEEQYEEPEESEESSEEESEDEWDEDKENWTPKGNNAEDKTTRSRATRTRRQLARVNY